MATETVWTFRERELSMATAPELWAYIFFSCCFMATETVWTFRERELSMATAPELWAYIFFSCCFMATETLWTFLGRGSPAWQQLLSSVPTSSNAALWPQRLYGLLGTGSPAWQRLLSSVAYPLLEEVCGDVLDIVTSRGLALTPLQSCFLLACAWP